MITSEAWGDENLSTVDPLTGIAYADTEKTIADKNDDNDCWLAAAANIMFWGGWVTAGDISIANEDRFFSFAVSCWGDVGGFEGDALYWWLNGSVVDENYSTPPLSGGGRLPQLDPADNLLEFYSAQYDKADMVCKMIDAGFGVTLGITNPDMSHAITCWGYEKIDGELYIFYSDSDDNKNTNYADRSKAPDSLKRTRISYNSATGEYNLADYRMEAVLHDLTAFRQYDVVMSGQNEDLTGTAKTVTVGTERRGRFDAENDDDAYRLTAPDTNLALAVSAAVAESQFTFELYDASGNLLAAQTALSAALNLSVVSGDDYYLRITGSGQLDHSDFLRGVYAINSAGDGGRAVKWSDGEATIAAVAHGSSETFALSDHSEYFSSALNSYSAAFIGLDAATNFYGGSLNGDTTGNCRFYFENGRIKTLYGGGGGKVEGDISIVTSGDTILASLLYGGGGGVGADVAGNVRLDLNFSKCTGNIFGGSFNAAVGGTVTLKIGSGQLSGLIFGGGRAYEENSSADTGDINITISGAAVSHTDNKKLLAAGKGNSAWIVGGGQAFNGGSVINTAVNITVNGGADISRIIGGAQAQGENSYAVVGSVAIFVENATVTGNIFGGGYARNHAQSMVTDTVTITVDSSISEVSLFGNIYLGGTAPGYPASGGDASIANGGSVIFTGKGELLNFSGTVSGDGTVPGSTAGTRTLGFKDFNGEFSASIKNFDLMTIAGNSAMTVGCDLDLGTVRFQVGGENSAAPAMLTANGINWSLSAENAIEVIFPEVFDTTENREFTLLDSDTIDSLSGLTLAVMFDADTTLAVLNIADGSSVEEFFGSFSLSINSGILSLKFTAPGN